MRFNFLADPLPEFVSRVLSLRLPASLRVQAAAAALVLAATGASSTIEALRLRSAHAAELRAQVNLEETRRALVDARLDWKQLDGLVASDRRLREIRRSGADVAERVTRLGNAFPKDAWMTWMQAGPSHYDVKARSTDIGAATSAIAGVLAQAQLADGSLSMRMSREREAVAGPVSFEIGTERP
jgi:hypothetical protein